MFGVCYGLIFRALQNYIGLRRAHVALTGAAPISPAIVSYFRTLGVPLVEAYGMTETSGMVPASSPSGCAATVGEPTVGRGTPHVANRASCRCAAAWCSRATTRIPRPPRPPSWTAGCTPATW